jgi:hypothetical protein
MNAWPLESTDLLSNMAKSAIKQDNPDTSRGCN